MNASPDNQEQYPRKRKRAVTAARKALLRKWAFYVYIENWPVSKVANKYGRGLTEQGVHLALQKAGYPKVQDWWQELSRQSRSRSLNEKQLQLVYKSKAEGATWAELARPYGMTVFQIAGIVRHACIRRGWEWPIKPTPLEAMQLETP